jgi:hypothetical protein
MTFNDTDTGTCAAPEAFAARDLTIRSLSKSTLLRIEEIIKYAALSGKSGISSLTIDVEKTDTAEAIEVLLLMYGYANIHVRPCVDFANREQYKMLLSFDWRTPGPY